MKLKTKSCPVCNGTGKLNADTGIGPKLRMERLRHRVRAYQVARAALIARWQEDAKAMDEMAEDDGDSTDEAMECRERSRTLRDCANDLEKPC